MAVHKVWIKLHKTAQLKGNTSFDKHTHSRTQTHTQLCMFKVCHAMRHKH